MVVPRKQYAILLNLPLALGFLAVSLTGLLNIHDPTARIRTAVLLAAFGGILFAVNLKHVPRLAAHFLLAVLTAIVCALMLLDSGVGYFPILFFLLGPFVTVQFPARPSAIWMGVFILCSGVIFGYQMGLAGMFSLAIYGTGYVFFGVFGWLLHQSEISRAKTELLLVELREAHRQLQVYAEQLEELTITQERNRISREMHDTLGHRLTIASVQLEGAQRLVRGDPGKAEKMIATVRDQVREGLVELRRTVAMLRSPIEEELPIGAALEKLVHQTSDATGIHIHLSVGARAVDLPGTHRQALYRAAQEGLTNVQRHARASEAWLRLEEREGKVTLTISDNGRGIPLEEQTGTGLSGLRERSALLGGACFLDARPGGGTQVTFELPLPKERGENG